MNLLDDLYRRIQMLETTVGFQIRVGVVSAVYPDRATARVRFDDLIDNQGKAMVSHELQIVSPNTKENKYYRLPDIDEQALCLFLANGFETGFIIGSVYSQGSKGHKPPVNSADKAHVRFKDGTWIEYDREAKLLKVNCVGKVELVADEEIILDSPQVSIHSPSVDHYSSRRDG